ncbi:MAG: hypothetical protein BroJett011_42470 [Chloroflexota bacterium]|nr:MAG: hypothetical protein BroJett011_42470 [Chloroflexota bacterium]
MGDDKLTKKIRIICRNRTKGELVCDQTFLTTPEIALLFLERIQEMLADMPPKSTQMAASELNIDTIEVEIDLIVSPIPLHGMPVAPTFEDLFRWPSARPV